MDARPFWSLLRRPPRTRHRAASTATPSVTKANAPLAPSALTIALYVPNLICYTRLALLAAAASLAATAPDRAALLFLINFVLDGVDGAVARRLGQTSSFGAFVDVAVDLASRGLLWVLADPAGRGLAVVLLEAITFTCTHAASGAAWKHADHFAGAPAWVRAVMANGFKTPLGALAIAGLMGCPLWAWARSALPPGSPWAHPLVGAVLVAGRLLAAAVELWLVGRHLGGLLRADVRAAAEGLGPAAEGAAAAPAGAEEGTDGAASAGRDVGGTAVARGGGGSGGQGGAGAT